MAKLIFGCGYLGLRVARRWRSRDEVVYAVTRSRERAERLAADGLQPIVADVLQPASLEGLPVVETVLYAIGYDRAGPGTQRDVFVDGLKSALDALSGKTGKLIYVSSTGVYGQTQGEWVDERSPCEPTRDGGRASLAAEQLLAAHALADRTVVLRMAGLYGPGRIPNAAAIRAGEPIAAPVAGWLNLIHVDDAAAVVLAAEALAVPPRTYVVSDGNPVERREYYETLARALGAPPARFVAPASDVPAASRASADKRVDNARMRAELGVELAYPSYHEGLAALAADA